MDAMTEMPGKPTFGEMDRFAAIYTGTWKVIALRQTEEEARRAGEAVMLCPLVVPVEDLDKYPIRWDVL